MIAILAGVAMVSHTPFVFPSLGPTAILLFYSPLSPTASPRHTIYGHAIGILCGYGIHLGAHRVIPRKRPGIRMRFDHHALVAPLVGVNVMAAALLADPARRPP
ncbi:MAG: HPP family protein, partial [Bryobacteraceae bacterium]